MTGNATQRGRGLDRADVADLLTFSRFLIAPVIAWLLAKRNTDTAVVLLGFAWLTDFLDGRFARAAERVSRLHRWDLRTDAWLGICLAVGLGFGGYISWWFVVPFTGLVFVMLLSLSNPALLAFGTGVLFGVFVWTATTKGGRLWWLPGAYVVVALVASRRRFFRIILPAVFGSLGALLSADPEERRWRKGIVLDDWVKN